MAEEETSVPVEVPQGIELPDTYLTPLGVQIQKLTTPNGDITLLKILVPNHIYTIKFTSDQARDLASGLTGGVHIATAAELPR